MKLYNSVGPNPHVVRMYAAECGVELDLEAVDLMAGDFQARIAEAIADNDDLFEFESE